jgi:hypothetical protein
MDTSSLFSIYRHACRICSMTRHSGKDMTCDPRYVLKSNTAPLSNHRTKPLTVNYLRSTRIYYEEFQLICRTCPISRPFLSSGLAGLKDVDGLGQLPCLHGDGSGVCAVSVVPATS